MKQQPLKKTIRHHINSRSLSNQQVDQLLNIQARASRIQTPQRIMHLRWAAAFSIVLTLIAGTLFFNLSPQYTLDERIGNEVAKNHINLKPLEVQTTNIQAIRNYFTELEFSPIESSLLQQANKSLLGGRYCSIQGVTAAQLRFRDKQTGQVQSLYQTLYKPEVFKGLPQLEEGQKPVTVYAKGLEVDIWVEKGLLFALTREVAVQDKPKK